jgi:hypothetical protein
MRKVFIFCTVSGKTVKKTNEKKAAGNVLLGL